MQAGYAIFGKDANQDGAKTGQRHEAKAKSLCQVAAELVVNKHRADDHGAAQYYERSVHKSMLRRANIAAAINTAGRIAQIADGVGAQAIRQCPSPGHDILNDEEL